MATGQRPFKADSRLSLLMKIVGEDARPPGEAALPPDLEKLILRCLRKVLSRRYQTMADLKVALDDLPTDTSGAPVERAAIRPSRSHDQTTRRAAMISAGALAVFAILFIAARVMRRVPHLPSGGP